MLAACVAQYVPDRRWRPAIVAAIGGLGVVVVGSPHLGADAGGALALTAGVCVAAAIATGGWLTFTRLAWATLAGLAVLIGFAVLDLRRPVAQRGSVGQFLTQLHAGTAGSAMHRATVNDVVTTLTSPLSLLVLFSIVFTRAGAGTAVGRPDAAVRALSGGARRDDRDGRRVGARRPDRRRRVRHRGCRRPSVALPLVTLAALRVLDHADDRTVARRLREEEPIPVL